MSKRRDEFTMFHFFLILPWSFSGSANKYADGRATSKPHNECTMRPRFTPLSHQGVRLFVTPEAGLVFDSEAGKTNEISRQMRFPLFDKSAENNSLSQIISN